MGSSLQSLGSPHGVDHRETNTCAHGEEIHKKALLFQELAMQAATLSAILLPPLPRVFMALPDANLLMLGGIPRR